MKATSSATSKLLRGGFRYLENREFRLVREAPRERGAWIQRAPHLSKPLRLVMPIHQQSQRLSWMIALGLFFYDHLAGKRLLPKAKRLSARELISRDSHLKSEGLQGGYEFSDGQMDDHALGLWVAEQAKQAEVKIAERTEVGALTQDGRVITADGATRHHDRLVNVAGPWSHSLLQESGIHPPYELDHVRGSHLPLEQPCKQACHWKPHTIAASSSLCPGGATPFSAQQNPGRRLTNPSHAARKHKVRCRLHGSLHGRVISRAPNPDWSVISLAFDLCYVAPNTLPRQPVKTLSTEQTNFSPFSVASRPPRWVWPIKSQPPFIEEA